ncbi:MAG: hypothetical protein H7336_15395 [Bacteriovorax sp.]|nr:hypothetical protein [Bacteriovorax sp.]
MLFFNLLVSVCFASTARIESKYVNIGESSKIYLRPGLITVLELPHPILEVRIGNPNDLKVVISGVSPRELTLYFKNSHANITNLIVKSDRKNYVFDVIPSSRTHQDYIKISGGIGSLNSSTPLIREDSRSISPEKVTNEKDYLIKEQLMRIEL